MKYLRTVIWTTFFLLLVSSSSFSADRTFRGKIIDAETLKPIEGAVVVAVWHKERFGGLLEDTRFKDAKETLTDKNGEWAITGTEGSDTKVRRFFQYMGVFKTNHPVFIIYKPGYTKYVAYGNFLAWPCISKEHNLEGIILRRPGDTKEERKEHYKKYKGCLPFIPLKDPERKLRDLDFSFEYPDKVISLNRTWCRNNKIKPYWFYTVVGLKKAKTRVARLEAMSFGIGPGASSKDEKPICPIVYKMVMEEREKIFGPARRKR